MNKKDYTQGGITKDCYSTFFQLYFIAKKVKTQKSIFWLKRNQKIFLLYQLTKEINKAREQTRSMEQGREVKSFDERLEQASKRANEN